MRSWRMLPGWDEVLQQSSNHKHHCISAYLMLLQWTCGILQTTLLSLHVQTIWAKPQLWGWITWRICRTISGNISSVFHTNPSQPGVCCCRTNFPGMVYEASGWTHHQHSPLCWIQLYNTLHVVMQTSRAMLFRLEWVLYGLQTYSQDRPLSMWNKPLVNGLQLKALHLCANY